MKPIKLLLLTIIAIILCLCGKKEVQKSENLTTKEITNNETTEMEEPIKPKIISKETQLLIERLNDTIRKFPVLTEYSLFTEFDTFFVKGDFFGDSIEDYALLLQTKDKVKLCIIDYGKETEIKIFGTKQKWDNINDDDFSWAGEFRVAKRGEVLWSNYDEKKDDFRSFEEVPETEKINLNYDALFLHMAEACGGGYIYWQNEKFNWLQQE